MRLVCLGVQLSVLLLAACAGARPEGAVAVPVIAAVVAPEAAQDGAPATPAAIAAPAPAAQVAAESAAKGKPPAAAPSHPPIARESPVHKPMRPVVMPAAVAPPVTSPAVTSPAVATSPVAAQLDLVSLEQRLRETRAIGVFTKLSLKNQVDDLLDQFRAHYRSAGPPALSALRERYDLLILKVLSLLQDGDPALARTIGSSREAIWGILNDPTKLAAT